MKEYERQKKMEDNEEADNNALAEQKKLQKFINTEQNITTTADTSKYKFCNLLKLFSIIGSNFYYFR